MISGMSKLKTSMTLDTDLLREVDALLLERESRTAFLEQAARAEIKRRRDERDRAILDRMAQDEQFMKDVHDDALLALHALENA
jgi:metal-responsive CopG/Arc/MetJ family transcriptional regulator